MTDAVTTSAVAAALDVGTRFGLPSADPVVLHQRSNVLVKLGNVVARVPGTTLLARPDPRPWLRRDVEVSRYLAGRGVRVVSPLDDAGPHEARGLPVTLWRFTPHEPGARLAGADFAPLLADLHAVLRDYPGDLPERAPEADLRRVFGRLALDGETARLGAELDRVTASLPRVETVPLHGDAHPGNLVVTADGPCWLDFEDTWRGPLAWDVGSMAEAAGDESLAAYPGGVPGLTAFRRLRRLFAVVWQFVVAERFPHRLDGARSGLAAYFSSPA